MRTLGDVLYNFHWIVPGKAARSAQAYAGFLGPFLRHRGIRSVINLRGPNPAWRWWRYEKSTCAQLEIEHHDVTLSSKNVSTRAMLVTPNLQEAAALTGATLARNEAEMEGQAREILGLGARHVLIKGGHGEDDEAVDLLIGEGTVVRLSAKRITSKNTHGTGCTLSSAIVAGLAKKRDIVAATQDAKKFLTAALAKADQLEVGHGGGPLHHFYKQWSAS